MQLEELDLEALGWIWQVSPIHPKPRRAGCHPPPRQQPRGRDAGTANFTTTYDDQPISCSVLTAGVDAVLLDAPDHRRSRERPDPQGGQRLAAHRTAGRWGNTQENIFVLLALDKYFNTYEAQRPTLCPHHWLGDTYAGSHEYRGAPPSATRRLPDGLPGGEELGGGQTRNLALSKEGDGAVLPPGLRYAPTDLELDPLDMALCRPAHLRSRGRPRGCQAG
jgi:hypothetical protein